MQGPSVGPEAAWLPPLLRGTQRPVQKLGAGTLASEGRGVSLGAPCEAGRVGVLCVRIPRTVCVCSSVCVTCLGVCERAWEWGAGSGRRQEEGPPLTGPPAPILHWEGL